MNLASWIILGVVIAVVALAAKATFFGKGKGVRPCCGEADEGATSGMAQTVVWDDSDEPPSVPSCRESASCAFVGPGCGDCAACQGAVARNMLQPVVHELDSQARQGGR